MTDYTPYQKGIIRRFYEHRDTLALQKLGEIVSNLYLETSEKKKDRLWKSAHAQMLGAGVHEHHARVVFESRDLEALAKLVGERS
jgi:hypothetical protein